MSEFSLPVRVYYEDTDAGGVVYYANYLRFMERARTEWLRGLGFEQDELAAQGGVIFAVRSAGLDFLRPARFNDALRVSARLVRCGRASLSFEQEVTREKQDGREVLCAGQVKIACVDVRTLRPRPIPEKLLAVIPDVD